ncbi:MAG: hypothetical protein ABFS14_11460 [Gemmatimonadota bacterium]
MITTDRFYRFGVLVAVCGALLPGCSRPVEPPPDSLFGVWEWVRAEGGVAGVTLTPETEGFSLQLRITRPDSIQLDRDGVAEVVTRFELISSSGSVFPRLRYDEPILDQEEHELRLSEGGLVLTDPCCDGFAYTWLPRLE